MDKWYVFTYQDHDTSRFNAKVRDRPGTPTMGIFAAAVLMCFLNKTDISFKRTYMCIHLPSFKWSIIPCTFQLISFTLPFLGLYQITLIIPYIPEKPIA